MHGMVKHVWIDIIEVKLQVILKRPTEKKGGYPFGFFWSLSPCLRNLYFLSMECTIIKKECHKAEEVNSES